jgi:fluoroacetyl-CoA thioesterase
MDASKNLKPGLSHHMEFVVEEKHTASHVGSGTVRVLSTPSMILFMEITARVMMDEYLPDTHTSVGAQVNVRHLAPSPAGSTVRAEVEITAVEGNKVMLDVTVWDGEEKIGEGQHERFVIDKERFLRRFNKTK